MHKARWLWIAAALAACNEGSAPTSGAPGKPSTTAPPPAVTAAATASASAAKVDTSALDGLPGKTIAGRITAPDDRPASDVVVYIKRGLAPAKITPPDKPVIVDQKNKAFLPRVLPIVAGTRVEFHNGDPVLHNVYSRAKAKTFDLGAFGSTEVKSVVFGEPGRVDVFCAIHTNMHSVILVLDTPYFATTDAQGVFRINDVPPGSYTLAVWDEVQGEQSVEATVTADRPAIVKHRLTPR